MKYSFAQKAIILSVSAIAPVLVTACGDSTSANDEDNTQSAVESSSSIAAIGISSSSIVPGSSSDVAGGITSSDAQVASSSSTGLIAPTGSFTDTRDGKIYKLTKIGSQTWMAEDLHFGDSTHYGFVDAQKVCPEKFHLPSLAEFHTLIDFAGGKDEAAIKLKSKTAWPTEGKYGNWNGTDDFGFNAVPVSTNDSSFEANYWTSTRNFGNVVTGDFIKINPYPTSTYQFYGTRSSLCFSPENALGNKEPGTVCEDNGEPESLFSVRCVSDVIECGSININIHEQFCKNGTAYNLCRGREFDVTKYKCVDNNLRDIATDSIYKFSWIYTLNPDVPYGTIIDERDGQPYKTLVINGAIWLAENMNYKVEGSLCPFNDEKYCDIYGRYYTQKMAIGGLDSVPLTNVQGICPAGFHVVNGAEYYSLYKNYGDNAYRDLYSQYREEDYGNVFESHKNETGFSLLLGSRSPSEDNWEDLNRGGQMMGKDFYHSFPAGWYRNNWYFYESDRVWPADTETFGNVRCVKD